MENCIKTNPNYILKTICSDTKLIPYAQAIADFNPTLTLPDENSFYNSSFSEDELFLLRKKGVLEDGFKARIKAIQKKEHRQYSLNIANIRIDCYGAGGHFPKEFSAFEYAATDSQPNDVCLLHTDLTVTYADYGNTPNGSILLRNDELWVIENDSIYILLFPTLVHIREIWLDKSAAFSVIFLNPAGVGSSPQRTCDDVFQAWRTCFLYIASQLDMYAVHSASIGYPADNGWLFSAPSGVGKSTHANLWQDLYNINMLNGDLNLISFADDTPYLPGIPWCGTSGIFTTQKYPLCGISLLRRAEADSITPLSPSDQVIGILHRIISPLWNEKQLLRCIDFCERLSGAISVVRLNCTKNASAAECMKEYIDGLYKS